MQIKKTGGFAELSLCIPELIHKGPPLAHSNYSNSGCHIVDGNEHLGVCDIQWFISVMISMWSGSCRSQWTLDRVTLGRTVC